MNLLTTLFWISLAILVYCYIGYGILAFLLQKMGAGRRYMLPVTEPTPGVTLIVAGYREDRIIEDKIRNSLEIGYPLEIIFTIDGETRAGEIFKKYPAIKFLHQPARKGKYEAIKRAMQEVRTPYVIFSDANSMLNKGSIQKILLHYADPLTGGVAGEKKIHEAGSSALGEAEGLYWQYESLMKELDAKLFTVIGAAGELYSIRTDLFRSVDSPVILDDFVISMQVCLQGYRIAYEPGAYAAEPGSGTLQDESKRRIRIAAGAYQSIGYLKKALNFFRYPLLAFQYFSRRILRWIACPPLILIVLLSNVVIVWLQPERNIYFLLLIIQIFFYALSLAGWFLIRNGKKTGWLGIPFYFLFMNYCMLRGLIRFLGKKQPVTWEKADR